MPLYAYQICDFDVLRDSRHATETTVTEQGMSCAYFIYIKTDING